MTSNKVLARNLAPGMRIYDPQRKRVLTVSETGQNRRGIMVFYDEILGTSTFGEYEALSLNGVVAEPKPKPAPVPLPIFKEPEVRPDEEHGN